MLGLIGIYGTLIILSLQIASGFNKLEDKLDSIEQRLKKMEDEE